MTSPFSGFSYPNQRSNNDRSAHLHITTIDQLADRSIGSGDNGAANEGEVVGYIQGYGPVTADPNISAAVIRGIRSPDLCYCTYIVNISSRTNDISQFLYT